MEAENNGKRLNTFVNQVISGYLEWDIHLVTRRFGVIEKSVLKEMTQYISSEGLEEIATKSANIDDIMPLTTGKQDWESLLHAVIVLARRSGYVIRIFENNKKRKIIIQHDLGAKWSEFYKAQVEQILKHANHTIMLETTDNSLIVYADMDLTAVK